MLSNRDVKNTFVPGYQKSINVWCDSYSQYKKELKKRGLIEIGYEDLPEKEDNSSYRWDDESIKKMVQNGSLDALDGQLISDMKEGKL